MQMKRALSADDAELAALDQEYAQLAAQDAGLTDGLHQRQQKQQRKGAAVANQCHVWENALQLRIMLQRCLQVGSWGKGQLLSCTCLAARQQIETHHVGRAAPCSGTRRSCTSCCSAASCRVEPSELHRLGSGMQGRLR